MNWCGRWLREPMLRLSCEDREPRFSEPPLASHEPSESTEARDADIKPAPRPFGLTGVSNRGAPLGSEVLLWTFARSMGLGEALPL
jgi:hypothetical protein